MSAIDNEDLIDYEEEVAVAPPSTTNGTAATGNGAATADADKDKKASSLLLLPNR
uniref:Uncharacterized protein n=1 Tax=Melanopsichium pennsylvanicum 4 TaxID=1398559 RepID=A0A077R8C8_9BASI|nr:uncharacterized protein BN887_03878 [Melanopsichium pennsylvanicum 4]